MKIAEYLSPEERRALIQRSNWRAAWVVLANIALVALGFILPLLWAHPLSWLAGTVLLGGRALGFGILTHDAAHGTLFKARATNEFLGRWLFGALPNVPFVVYRAGHLSHHKNAGTELDPDIGFVAGYPTSTASLRRKLLRDISGLNGLKNIGYQLQTASWSKQAPFLLLHGLLLTLLLSLGQVELYAMWWAGQLFVFPLVLRLRVMGEHGAVADHFASDPRLNTRTTLVTPLERLLIAPNFVNYHVEHHLAAGVPCYNLPRMHRLLQARGAYQGFDCVAGSFVDVLRRCIGTPDPELRRFGSAAGALANMQ